MINLLNTHLLDTHNQPDLIEDKKDNFISLNVENIQQNNQIKHTLDIYCNPLCVVIKFIFMLLLVSVLFYLVYYLISHVLLTCGNRNMYITNMSTIVNYNITTVEILYLSLTNSTLSQPNCMVYTRSNFTDYNLGDIIPVYYCSGSCESPDSHGESIEKSVVNIVMIVMLIIILIGASITLCYMACKDFFKYKEQRYDEQS